MVRKGSIVVLTFLVLLAPLAVADVKTEERTKIELPGLLGGFMKTFGGKAARDGIVNKIALKGNRKMTVNDETAELVDLTEEKIYQIDLKKKTYTVLTFEEMRKQMEEAMEKAKAEAAKASSSPKPEQTAPAAKEPDVTIDFKLAESGQKSTINGYECREVVATITVRQKDKKPEDGSMVVTSNLWLAPRIAAMKELEEFDLRLAQELYLPVAKEMAASMAPAMAAYPGLTEAMGKLETEKVNMDGTAIRTIVKAEITGAENANQSAQAKPASENKQQPEIPKSIGGLLGGLGRKAAPRNEDNTNKSNSATFMTTTTELVSVSTTVSEADVSIPAGFKERK